MTFPKLKTNLELKESLRAFLSSKLYSEQVGVSIMDFSKDSQVTVAGYHERKLIYPASIYKLFVAGALLDLIARNKDITFQTEIIVSDVNVIDTEKEVPSDPRPLLKAGQKVSVEYVCDLMITRSDNTAANCLIDFLGRPQINEFILRNGWKGSEVTRKFLPRANEDEEYKEARPTKTKTRHLAEFLLAVEKGRIGSPELSLHLKTLLGQQLDTTKMSLGFPETVHFFHKTGWWDKDNVTGFTGDCGIVEDGKTRYVVVCLTALPTEEGSKVLAEIAIEIHRLVKMYSI